MSIQGNGGFRSKFQERLRRMRLFRLRKRFFQEKQEQIKERDNFVSEVLSNIKNTADDRNYTRIRVGISDRNNSVIKNNKDAEIKGIGRVDSIINKNDNIVIKENNILNNSDLDDKVNYIRENKPIVRRKKAGYVVSKKDNINNISDVEKKDLLNEIGTDIINKLKDSFLDKLDELDVLSSELYILSLYQDSQLELNKVKEVKVRINELIGRINEIIDQYNLYKKNYYIDNVIGIDDNVIVDNIISYRDLLDSFNDEKKFVKEYKALDEFKALYNNLVEIKDETERLQLSNEEKIKEYDIRDKRYDNVKIGLIFVLDIDKKCSLEIKRQNEYFDNLIGKINDIDTEEYVTVHMRGIGELVGQSLRYMGLMLLSPLSGLIPSIAMQTVATRNMIRNIRSHLHVEDVRHIHYEAVNYDSELNNHLTSVNYTENLIDDTLKDVEKLKEDFMMIYNCNIPGYEDTLKRIEEIEVKLLHNQNRVSIVKKNLKNSKKLNEDKIKRVRRLNDDQRSA